MPRRNNTPPHTYYQAPQHQGTKKRYPSQQLAQKAADEAMLLQAELQLSVYRGLDGGWYLTSRKSDQ